jgi:hypothetical protein
MGRLGLEFGMGLKLEMEWASDCNSTIGIGLG